jgi:hypothetical protein
VKCLAIFHDEWIYYTLIASTDRVHTHFCFTGIIIAFFALHQPVGILKDFTLHRFSGGMSRISSTAPAQAKMIVRMLAMA